MRHLIDPLDFTKEETQKLLDLADRIHDDPEAYQDVADHKRLATLFYAFYRLFFYKTRFSAGAEPHCSASLPFLPPYLC